MKQTIGRKKFLGLLKSNVSEEDLKEIEDAYTLAKYGHRNQLRTQGGRYFEHPKAVAMIIIQELGINDPEIIEMALLHDVIEDTFILSEGGLRKLFGKRVVRGLDFLTKRGKVDEYVKRLYKVMDLGIIIVKLADRLHNLRTLIGCPQEKIVRITKQTNEHYLPLVEHFLNENLAKNDRAAITYLKINILSTLENLKSLRS